MLEVTRGKISKVSKESLDVKKEVVRSLSEISSKSRSSIKLPKMTKVETEIFELAKEIMPQALYSMGIEELGDRVWIPSEENIAIAVSKINRLKLACYKSRDRLCAKYLDSLLCQLQCGEPQHDLGSIVDVLSAHLIKEGVNTKRISKLIDQLSDLVLASLQKFEKRRFTTALKVLVQYAVMGSREIISVIERESGGDRELLGRLRSLRERVEQFSLQFSVNGFGNGEFERVDKILRREGAYLGRESFYKRAIRSGFDYHETPADLEKKALRWLGEDLPKLRRITKKLSRTLKCPSDPESVERALKSRPQVSPQEAVAATRKIRPVIKQLVEKYVVGINPSYNCEVLETPSYLAPVLPSAGALGLDAFTDHPVQRYYVTTDPKRDPIGGFAELVNTLVHEEFGHCVHFSNSAISYAANPRILELLPSLHGGPTSEGLAFQREFEFLVLLKKLSKKRPRNYSQEEENYVALTREYGGFEQTLQEIEFATYRFRIVRFLRVVGDVRINTGKQDLIEFLDWSERKTGIPARTIFYQLFPAHESIFPGYATCYAVVGQEIKEIQRPFMNDSHLMVCFNAYSSSMGYPPRSIYIERLKKFAKDLMKTGEGKERKKEREGEGSRLRSSKRKIRMRQAYFEKKSLNQGRN